MVKYLAQGHKCHGRDSKSHSAASPEARPLGHDTPILADSGRFLATIASRGLGLKTNSHPVRRVTSHWDHS